MSMIVGLWTLPAFFVTFFGYIVFSSVLQYLYYYCRADSATSWKVQPSQRNGLGDSRWWLPAFRSKLTSKETHPLHRLFATVRHQATRDRGNKKPQLQYYIYLYMCVLCTLSFDSDVELSTVNFRLTSLRRQVLPD